MKDEYDVIKQWENRLLELSSEFEGILDSLTEEEKEADAINDNEDGFVKAQVTKEVKVITKEIKKYGAVAIFENIKIKMQVYFAKIEGEIIPKNEIKEYIWIDKNYEKLDIKLGTVLSEYIIPNLVKNDIM
jgi:hypothetical protein